MAHDIGPIGGMERQLTELITGLLKRGHDVTVIARRCDLPPHPALRWVRVPGPAKPFPLAYPVFFVLGSWQLWRHRAGLVHTTGAIVLNRADVCTIHWCHFGAQKKAGSRWRELMPLRRVNRRLSGAMARLGERLLYRASRVQRFVAVSRGLAVEMREHFPKISAQITVIPNGVDQNAFRPDPVARHHARMVLSVTVADLVALFVGGDWGRKGLSLAIEAAASVPECHLLVVGAGDVERFKALARRLNADRRVHFVGRRKDTACYYAASDVFLLPTLYETFSLVSYEAAASGLPLLVTKVSGVEDLLRDGENGWFIPRDSGAIRLRLQVLQADVALRRRMAARSRELVAPNTWGRVVDDYVDLYERLTAAPSSVVPELMAERR